MTQDTSMTKNFVKTEFKSLGWLILMGLCLTGLLFSSDDIFAIETIDDFDLYPVETRLDGVGNWFDPAYSMIVKDDRSYSTPHSALFDWSLGYRDGRLDLRENNTTDLAFKIYLKECPTGQPFSIYFRDWDLNIFAGFQSVEMIDDECEITGVRSGSNEIIGSVPLNTWATWVFQQNQIEELSYVRYSLNSGEDFSDFWPIDNGVFRDIDVFWITGNANNVFYIDDIIDGLPVCELGSCKECKTYDACVGADCFWYYYSPYIQLSYCVEPFEAGPEICGPLWKCQYCLTQELCEAETGSCEWADRGFGEKCYVIEPTILPEQEWEVPDLEDCDLLSGVEKLLCEIKNDALGIFMPSQEKINDLFQTINAFKSRFPFNYIDSLKRFFSDISESFSEEKTIPIKILGQESNVSFEFWDQETEIGGIAETFKNILFDFTTLIVILGFFVWLIGLIGRFF